ncbi:uncharacterized protein [Fopius arisanus]|uniref:Centromere protein M n=1 Tax=Fopius arisanus TaxID=64838 RepID=A0A9R1TGH0_9HYME|nr:PREDICTED: uncharacterized protein LOC105269847 [Fopius arisanus]
MAGVLRSCSGLRASDSTISFLVVASSEICEKITDSLHLAAKNRKCRLVVHQCEAVSQVVKSRTNLAVDFIVFAIDGQVTHSISEVESNISCIDENYVISGSVSLVYCHNTSGSFGMTYHRAKELSRKYCLRKFLNTDIQDAENCFLLAERLLTLAEEVVGLKTGFPLCNV